MSGLPAPDAWPAMREPEELWPSPPRKRTMPATPVPKKRSPRPVYWCLKCEERAAIENTDRRGTTRHSCSACGYEREVQT